jgi:hypothetical protein
LLWPILSALTLIDYSTARRFGARVLSTLRGLSVKLFTFNSGYLLSIFQSYSQIENVVFDYLLLEFSRVLVNRVRNFSYLRTHPLLGVRLVSRPPRWLATLKRFL